MYISQHFSAFHGSGGQAMSGCTASGDPEKPSAGIDTLVRFAVIMLSTKCAGRNESGSGEGCVATGILFVLSVGAAAVEIAVGAFASEQAASATAHNARTKRRISLPGTAGGQRRNRGGTGRAGGGFGDTLAPAKRPATTEKNDLRSMKERYRLNGPLRPGGSGG